MDNVDDTTTTKVAPDLLFEPLHFRSRTVKNRVFRSSTSGRRHNHNGSGTPARVKWEEAFARGGVGAVIPAHAPVHVSGRILPHHAHLDDDDEVPCWRVGVDPVHTHECAFILQLSHGGRQRDIAGVENAGTVVRSATDRPDPVHGVRCHLHVHVKISTTDHNSVYLLWQPPRSKVEDMVEVCQRAEAEAEAAIHVSTGSFFPHPLNPAGDFALAEVAETHDTMLCSGVHVARKLVLFRFPPTRQDSA
jgi:2,4-dienoyl-CoA reductase-like NADH-dependent reductase (Old Yellow Enzyme family)